MRYRFSSLASLKRRNVTFQPSYFSSERNTGISQALRFKVNVRSRNTANVKKKRFFFATFFDGPTGLYDLLRLRTTVLPRNWIISIESRSWSCPLAGTVRVDLFVPVIALCDENVRSFHLNGNTKHARRASLSREGKITYLLF